MSGKLSQLRTRAKKVGGWLVEKERPEEAVNVLVAWAAQGPNNNQGQELLAEALRVDPSSRAAQMAFERMEGIEGEHADLDALFDQYDERALEKLEAELRKPTFRRAQMGFNNNINCRGERYHVQTEDSGLDAPHVITHLFADGGRVVKSHKRSYQQAIEREPDIATYVRQLMKAQHMEMVLALRDGNFDAIIAGEAVGGVEVLEAPPRVDVAPRAGKKKSPPTENRKSRVLPASQNSRPPYYLTVLRSLVGGPDRYQPESDVVVIGSRGGIALKGERFCGPEEAALNFQEGQLLLEELDGTHGIFVRVRRAAELALGDEFMVGDQLLRVEHNPVPSDGPDPDPTYFYSSPKWPSSFRVSQIFSGGAKGSCALSRGKTLQIGSAVGELLFPHDLLVDPQHCVVEEQAGGIVVTDLNSRTGLFVRARGQHVLNAGDELLVGRTRLVVQMQPPSN